MNATVHGPGLRALLALAAIVWGMAGSGAVWGQPVHPQGPLDLNALPNCAGACHRNAGFAINKNTGQKMLLAQNSGLNCSVRNACGPAFCQQVKSCCDANQNCTTTNVGQPFAANSAPPAPAPLQAPAPALAADGRKFIGNVKNHCDGELRLDFMSNGRLAFPSITAGPRKRNEFEVPAGTYDVRIFRSGVSGLLKTNAGFVVAQDKWVILETCGQSAAAPARGAAQSTIGTVKNECNAHEVRFEFKVNDKVVKAVTLAPRQKDPGVELLSGEYKVRVWTRPSKTMEAVAKELAECKAQLQGKPIYNHGAMKAEFQKCDDAARNTRVGPHGEFVLKEHDDAFSVTTDLWSKAHNCRART